jgi:ABC-2 type transport system permease protein
MSALRQLSAVAVKEFRVLLRDRRTRTSLVLLPLLQLLIFGYAATFEVTRAPIGILDEDHGPQGRELAARFAGSPMFRVAALPTDDRDIRRLIDNAEVVMMLRIGQRFSAELLSGTLPDVQFIVDGRNLTTASTVQGYAASVLAGFSRDYAAANGLALPTALTVARAWFNPNLLSRWFVVPALIAKLMLVAVLTTAALSFARERELGTLERVFLTRLTPIQLLIGKAVAPLVLGTLQAGLMIVVGVFWFAVPLRGSIGLLSLSMAVGLFSILGVGLLISTVARTQQRAVVGTFMFMIPAVMFSGFATPIASMPDWMQVGTLINPLRYLVAVMRELFLRALGWDFVWPQLWPMALIGLISLALAHRLLMRRVR